LFRPFWQETSETDDLAGRKNCYSTPLLVGDANVILAGLGPNYLMMLPQRRVFAAVSSFGCLGGTDSEEQFPVDVNQYLFSAWWWN
jgi:hypothetical protein